MIYDSINARTSSIKYTSNKYLISAITSISYLVIMNISITSISNVSITY